jgi:hypothetical protein
MMCFEHGRCHKQHGHLVCKNRKENCGHSTLIPGTFMPLNGHFGLVYAQVRCGLMESFCIRANCSRMTRL